MTVQKSNAGPFRFRLGAIAVDATERVNTENAERGPRNKVGGLKKYYGKRGGFDYVSITNMSDEVVTIKTNGEVTQDVPPASDRVISGMGPNGTPDNRAVAYTFVEVTNTGIVTSAQINADKISVSFGNGPRPEEGRTQRTFDPFTIIPGVVRNGG